MADGSLTQEEIDLLLQGASNFGGADQSIGGGEAVRSTSSLSQAEVDQIVGMFHNGFQAGIPGLGQILGKSVKIGPPSPKLLSQSDLEKELGTGYSILRLKINGSMDGRIALVVPVQDAAKIADVIMGGDGGAGAQATSLDSAQVATIKDTLSPFLFNALNRVSVRIGSPITPQISDLIVTGQGETFPLSDDSSYLQLTSSFSIEGLVDSTISLVLPVRVASTMVKMGSKPEAMQAIPGGAIAGGAGAEKGPQQGESQADIKTVHFPSFNNIGAGPTAPNMNLLMDVQMTLTVELGRTKMYIKEILGLGEGSIIELDKLAGEPVDLLINGRLIAKGEVVVIDENFGVRVTDIVSPVDRIKGHKQNNQEG